MSSPEDNVINLATYAQQRSAPSPEAENRESLLDHLTEIGGEAMGAIAELQAYTTNPDRHIRLAASSILDTLGMAINDYNGGRTS